MLENNTPFLHNKLSDIGLSLGAFVDELERQARDHYADDPYLGAYAQGAYDEMQIPGSPFAAEIIDVVRQRADLDLPTQLVNHVARAIQADFLSLSRDYPDRTIHTKPFIWQANIQAMMADPVRLEKFRGHMNDVVPSTVDERYKLLQTFMPLFGLGTDPMAPASILDVGCSLNIGLKKLELVEEYPFDPLQIGKHVVRLIDGKEKHHLIVDNEQTAKIQQLMLGKLALGDCLGVDMLVPADSARSSPEVYEQIAKYVESCSFYPTEIEQRIQRYRNFQKLAHTRLPNIHFLGDNFAHPRMDRFNKLSPVRQFNAAFLSTMLHQSTPSERVNILETTVSLLKPGGVAFILEFAHLNDEGELVMYPKWTDYHYQLFAIKAADPAKIIPLATIKGGRTTEAELSPQGEQLLRDYAA